VHPKVLAGTLSRAHSQGHDGAAWLESSANLSNSMLDRRDIQMKEENHLAEYITCLIEDPTLLEALKKEPAATLNDARLSKEEKDALWSGDSMRVQAMVGSQKIPDEVRDAITALGAHKRKVAG